MKRNPGVLLLVVFVSGMSSLGIELTASRLIGNYFGSSQPIWAAIIGMVLIYLTIGYLLGGRLADRYPRQDYLYQLTAWAGFFTGVIPLVSHPVLQYAAIGMRNLEVGVFGSALVGVILLLSLPMVLFGCVSPFAIRLQTHAVESSGNTAGHIYALSTVGSILGTFLPTLVLIPAIGTRATFLLFAVVVMLASLLGLLGARRRRVVAYALLLAAIMALSFATPRGPIRAAESGKLIFETESSYNYIQVVESGGARYLVLNEGQAVHSIYDPKNFLTHGPWDYFMVAPYFNAHYKMSELQRVAFVGLAAGTEAQQITQVYGPIPIDGVEIDPAIVQAGRTYFDMTEPNINPVIQDGRYFIKTTEHTYDLIGVDAYRQPYIPAQLTTQEFFQEAYDHLTERGVVMLNAGGTQNDRRLVNVLASTMRSVFPNVYIIEIPYQEGFLIRNSMIVATKQPTQIENFAQNVKEMSDPVLIDVADSALRGGISEVKDVTVVFTDDKAPVEQVVDQIILGYALGGR